MLATRGLTVREVAHRVGYRQPAQFAKAFRRYQGVAPSDFRAAGRAVRRTRLARRRPGSAARRVPRRLSLSAGPDRAGAAFVGRARIGCRPMGLRRGLVSSRASARAPACTADWRQMLVIGIIASVARHRRSGC